MLESALENSANFRNSSRTVPLMHEFGSYDLSSFLSHRSSAFDSLTTPFLSGRLTLARHLNIVVNCLSSRSIVSLERMILTCSEDSLEAYSLQNPLINSAMSLLWHLSFFVTNSYVLSMNSRIGRSNRFWRALNTMFVSNFILNIAAKLNAEFFFFLQLSNISLMVSTSNSFSIDMNSGITFENTSSFLTVIVLLEISSSQTCPFLISYSPFMTPLYITRRSAVIMSSSSSTCLVFLATRPS